MSALAVESQEWPRGLRWIVCLLILAGQLGLVFWLARQKTPAVASFASVPLVYVSPDVEKEFPALTDPTLFVLANQNGFSGKAWMQIPKLEYDVPVWNEPAQPLALKTANLGAGLGQYLETNFKAEFQPASHPEPDLSPVVPVTDLAAAPSTVSVEGEIASHPLLFPLKLSGWPSADILNETRISIAVDSEGKVLSAILQMDSKSGSKDADASALNLAKSARFAPWRGDSATRLRWGELIFHWQTLPLTAAAAASITP